MSAYVSRQLRQLVSRRARQRCEYCLALPNPLIKHEPDHVLPLRHGGLTNNGNLALACYACNRNKGPCAGSLDFDTNNFVGFFNPRTQIWTEHFRLNGAIIEPLTPEARVTERFFGFNEPGRVTERARWIRSGLY